MKGGEVIAFSYFRCRCNIICQRLIAGAFHLYSGSLYTGFIVGGSQLNTNTGDIRQVQFQFPANLVQVA